MKKSKKQLKSIYVVINIILLVTCYILINIFSKIYLFDYQNLIKIIGWISSIMFLICEFLIYKKKHTLLDFDILFFLFFFLFCNGQIFLYSYGVDSQFLSVFTRASYDEILVTAKYYCISQMFFSLGILLIDNSTQNELYIIEDKGLLKSLKITGILIMLSSLIPFLYNFIPMIKNSIIYGYGYLYSDPQELQGTIGYLSTFFIPSFFILLFAEKQNKFKFKLIRFILVFIAFLYLIIGTRSTAIRIIVSLIVFNNIFIKKINWKKTIKLLLITIFILILIPTVHQFRGKSNKDIFTFKEAINETLTSDNNNFIIQSISELGFSSYSFILTRRTIPNSINYKYGQSYFASILMLIPSSLMGGFSFAKYANLDVWLQNFYKMSYGPGFSIIAETYYNFGWYFGPIFTIVISMFFSYIFSMHSSDKDKNTIFKLLSFIFFYSSLIKARFPFHSTIRNVFYMYFCIYVLIYFIYRKYKERDSD